jgi:protease-4
MSELESPQVNGTGGGQAIPPVPPAPPLPPPRKSRTGIFLLGTLTGCAVVFAGLLFFGILVAAMGADSGDIALGDKVAVVSIEGEISESRKTVDDLRKYAKNAGIKAIVVRIDSPGGAIAPSQEIYSAIRQIRTESKKPIVASLDSVAASGGFYIAAACDQIVANPGSIVGSIGVILEWFELHELVRWAKMNPQTITSGALKDAGSPYRQMTPAERQYFQSIVSQLHTQFVRDVAQGRRAKMKHEDVARIADGRIFTGEQALALKLVDQLGSVDDAVRTAGRLAGVKGEPARVWPKPREDRLLELLTGGDADALAERVVSRRVPQFLYRW